MFDIKRICVTKASVLAVLLASLTLFGCIGPRGWAGIAVVDGGTLVVGSMDGSILSLDPLARREQRPFPSDGEWKWEPEEQKTGGSLFDCTAQGQFAGGKFYGIPVVVDDFAYIGAYDGRVFAIDARDTGNVHTEWSYDIGSPIVGGVAVPDHGDAVYVGASDGKLYALDRTPPGTEGRSKEGFQSFQTGDKVWATPVIEGEVVYFGSLDHKLYAVDARTGELKWDEPFETGGAIASTPLIARGVVYFGSFDSKFYAVYAGTGKSKWTEPFEAGGWFWARAVYDEDRGAIYACSLDHKVYAIDAETGGPKWDKPFETDSPLLSSAVISGGVVVVVSENGKVYGINPDTGKEAWDEPVDLKVGVHAPLAEDGGKVYVNDLNNRVHSIDAANGALGWNESLGD